MSSDCTAVPVLHVRSTALGPRNPRVPAGSQMNVCPRYLEDEDLRNLDRTSEVFRKIEMEEHMVVTLPKPASTAGHVLAHACSSFESLHSKHSPMTFKFGITHCAHFRWHHRPYGYRHGLEKFTNMVILYAASNPYGPAFLEASLIRQYGSFSAQQKQAHNDESTLHCMARVVTSILLKKYISVKQSLCVFMAANVNNPSLSVSPPEVGRDARMSCAVVILAEILL